MYPTTNNQIFVSIICWRDPFIFNTVKSAYDNARYPQNLQFGVIFQGYEEDQWMIENLSSITSNIKMINIRAEDLTEAPSITHLRGDVMNTLMEDESYVLQIDSHMKFDKDWDLGMMAELKIANDHFGKSILMSWPTAFHSWESEAFKEDTLTSLPDKEFFEDDDHMTIHGTLVHKEHGTMIREKFYNANCTFSYKEYVQEVEQPNNIRFWFDAPLMSLRTFTGGYDMVSSSKTYVNNFSYRVAKDVWDPFIRHEIKDDPKFADSVANKYISDRAFYDNILANKVYDAKNGMLSERTYEEFEEFVGYDLITLDLNRSKYEINSNDHFSVNPLLLDSMIEEIIANAENSN
jgi:hypothetical protein